MRERLLTGLILLLLLAWLVPSQHKTAAAPPQQFNDAVVVTGQIIPAFIGGAYDPTEAFKQLAGLPIYVYTIDNFNSTSGFVTHNIAIRTQIRADGTFQAQGVTSATTKAIYFPFAKTHDNRIARTDCRSGVNEGKGQCPAGDYSGWVDVNGNNTPDTDETGYLIVTDVLFRWPTPLDKIQDVFSYTFTNPLLTTSATPIVNSQICTDYPNCGDERNYEKVVILQSFLTTTTRVEKENSINVFPVVPHSALRVQAAPAAAGFDTGATYEVVAHRVSAPLTTGSAVESSAEFPTIRGRTNPLAPLLPGDPQNIGLFQAYAPPGFYAVTLWRSQAGALTYEDYNPLEPAPNLNSAVNGFSLMSAEKDWESLVGTGYGLRYMVFLWGNRIAIWGLVSGEQGDILSEANRGADTDKGDLRVSVISDTRDINGNTTPYYGKMSGSNTTSPCDNTDETCRSQPAVGSLGALPYDRSWHGIYTLFQVKTQAVSPPTSEHAWVKVDGFYSGPGGVNDNFVTGLYQSSPTAPAQIVSGADGPVRIDLVASKSDKGNSTGFDSGIHLKVQNPSGEGIPTAQAQVFLQNDTTVPNLKLTALNKTYPANRLGEIHILDQDLFPFPCSGASANRYIVAITAPGKDTVFLNGAPGASNAAVCYENRYSQTYWDNPLSLSFAPPPSRNYRFLGLIPIPFAQAATGVVEIPVIMQYGQGRRPSGTVTALLSFNLPGVPSGLVKRAACLGLVTTGCEVGFYDTSGFWQTTTDVAAAPDGRFAIRVARTLSPTEYKEACVKAGNKPFSFRGITHDPCARSSDVSVSSYKLEVSGTTASVSGGDNRDFITDASVSVDSNGFFSPTQINLLPEVDCDKLAADAYPGGGATDILKNAQHAFMRVGTSLSCGLAKQFAIKAPEAFGFIQRHVLQTRAVSGMGSVVELWNTVRALTNVLFIVILIIVAFGTIFRFNPKEWDLGLVLPGLITGMVLANFSLLIVQALIDTSNVLTQSLSNLTAAVLQGATTDMGEAIFATGLAGGGAAVAGGAAIASSIAAWMSTAVISGLSVVGASGGLAIIPILLFAVVGIVIGILIPILGLIILLLSRYAIIWIATVLAPLIFAISALPGKTTGGLRGLWFATILPFIFMTPLIAFIMGLGLMLLTYGASENSFVAGLGIALTAIFTLKLTSQAPAILSSIFGKGLFDAGKILPGQDVDWGKRRGNIEKEATGKIERRAERQTAAEQEEKLTGRQPFSRTPIGRVATRVPGLSQAYWAARGGQLTAESTRQKAIESAEKGEEYRARTALSMGGGMWGNFATSFNSQTLDDPAYDFTIRRARTTATPTHAVATAHAVNRSDLTKISKEWNKSRHGGKMVGVNAFRHLYGYGGDDKEEIQRRTDFINAQMGWTAQQGLTGRDYKDLRADISGRGSSISTGGTVRQHSP